MKLTQVVKPIFLLLRVSFLASAIFFLILPLRGQVYATGLGFAEDDQIEASTKTESPQVEKTAEERQQEKNTTSVNMLQSIIELKNGLEKRIKNSQRQLKRSSSDSEKLQLEQELLELDQALAGANADFERIATGVDVGVFSQKTAEKIQWEDELVALVEPLIKEIKRLTFKVRYKAQLKDDLMKYQALLPVAEQAKKNLQERADLIEDRAMRRYVQDLMPEWEGVAEQLKSKLEIVQLELEKLEQESNSLSESSSESIKKFFKTRGLFLLTGLAVCIGLILFMRLFARLLIRLVPGSSREYRPFHARVIDLFFKVFTVFLALFSLVFVFYGFEDWVLLSLTILLLLGLALTVKNTLPRFLKQSRLMLNIGPVREGERIVLHGVPWLVKHINVYTRLENPYLGVRLRLPIEELTGHISRPYDTHEPWFPCRKRDWVILSDGTRGCVTSLSHEMVELVLRGGAKKTYQTQDFLSLSPLNLSVNFRIKTAFGISYDLQATSTNTLLANLEEYIQAKIEEEELSDMVLNLRVEFAQAGGSSLDLVVITDFKGEMAPLYSRLERSIQRWCTDACTAHDWEIPFPQLTVHRPSS